MTYMLAYMWSVTYMPTYMSKHVWEIYVPDINQLICDICDIYKSETFHICRHIMYVYVSYTQTYMKHTVKTYMTHICIMYVCIYATHMSPYKRHTLWHICLIYVCIYAAYKSSYRTHILYMYADIQGSYMAHMCFIYEPYRLLTCETCGTYKLSYNILTCLHI